MISLGVRGFAVSPDGRWVLYKRVDQIENDLVCHKVSEMLRHCAAIVRNQNASFTIGSRQDLWILKTVQTCLGGGLEINRALVSPHRPHYVFIEIGIRLKSDFHR